MTKDIHITGRVRRSKVGRIREIRNGANGLLFDFICLFSVGIVAIIAILLYTS